MASSSLKLRQILTKTAHLSFRTTQWIPIRNSSYETSRFLEDVAPVTTKYQVTKVPEEWEYVKRVLPPTTVPEPPIKTLYPSGWQPQGAVVEDRPYFVQRTKNHMMPVYLKIYQRGIKRHTIIRHIQGDIWQFEREIREFLSDLIKPLHLRLQVDEFSRKICINGDHVNAIKYWLGQRNL